MESRRKSNVRGAIIQAESRGDRLLTGQFAGAAEVDSDHRGRKD
jgi:hypothetical protein